MRSTTLDLTLLTLMVAGLIYFSVDAWVVSSGVGWSADLEDEIEAISLRIDALESERDRLEDLNRRLRGPEIDLELLDERLRARFGVGRADEALLLAPPASTLR